jgi:hypothetical protein
MAMHKTGERITADLGIEERGALRPLRRTTVVDQVAANVKRAAAFLDAATP